VNVLKAAFVASIAIFVWGFVFWWSPLPYRTLKQIDTSNEDVMSYLRTQFSNTGVYMIPYPGDDLSNLGKLRETGTAMTVYVLSDDDSLPVWGSLLAGFARIFAATSLAGWALLRALPALRNTFSARALFILLIAAALVVYKDLADPIWWYFPWSWNLVKAFYDVVAWLLASLILAALIRQPA